MIKIENVEVVGLEHAIRGMRNPMNSWEKSDSTCCMYSTHDSVAHCNTCEYCHTCHADDKDLFNNLIVGDNDHDLMMKLANGGPVHAKYRRMIVVYLDITAPLYWWKEFDTYKVGTVANSCSTMHKIHEKEFTLEDFSCEHLYAEDDRDGMYYSKTAEEMFTSTDVLKVIIEALNNYRKDFLTTKDKKYWWQMIQLLPSSYNQRRTIMLNYEVLAGLHPDRKPHKLDEWREFCKWIESLPYSEIITGKKTED